VKGPQLQCEENKNHAATVALATGTFAVGNFYGEALRGAKMAEKAVSERADGNVAELRIKLEKRIVNAERVPTREGRRFCAKRALLSRDRDMVTSIRLELR
jgi:hypothetical protein